MSTNGEALKEKQRATAFATYLLRALPLAESLEEALEATEVALAVQPAIVKQPIVLPQEEPILSAPALRPLVIHQPKTGRVQGGWSKKQNSIRLGMVGDEWHGPKPPGDGWVQAGKGPRGGLRWKRQASDRKQEKEQPGIKNGERTERQTEKKLTPEEVTAFAEEIGKNPTPEKALELINHLRSLTREQIGTVKKGIGIRVGIRVGGRKEEMIQKVAALATQRLTVVQRFAREARKLGYTQKDLRYFARQARAVHNGLTDQINKVQSEARNLYAHFSGGKLSRSMSAFRRGDYTEIPHFDQISRSLAGRFPEILGDAGYTATSGYNTGETAASERLFELIAAGKVRRMSYEKSYQSALDQLRELGPKPKQPKRQPVPAGFEEEELPF